MSEVSIYCYDLSKGVAKTVPGGLTGTSFEGIWHSSVVAFGLEYFFGSGVGKGICTVVPRSSHYGEPTRCTVLGTTTKTVDEFHEWRDERNESDFLANTYMITGHNCNHFTHEALCFLLDGKGAPDDVINMIPNMIDSPLASMLFAFFTGGTMTLDQALKMGSSHPMAQTVVPKRDTRACDFEEAEARRKNRNRLPMGLDNLFGGGANFFGGGGAKPEGAQRSSSGSSFPFFGGGFPWGGQAKSHQRHRDPNENPNSPSSTKSRKSQASFVEEVSETSEEAEAAALRADIEGLKAAISRSVEAHHSELELLVEAMTCFTQLLAEVIEHGEDCKSLHLDEEHEHLVRVSNAMFGQGWLIAAGFRCDRTSGAFSMSPLHASRRSLFEEFYRLAAGAQEAAEIALALRLSSEDGPEETQQQPTAPRAAAPKASPSKDEIMAEFATAQPKAQFVGTEFLEADVSAVLEWAGVLLSPCSNKSLPKNALSIAEREKPLLVTANLEGFPPGEPLAETSDDLFDPDAGCGASPVAAIPPLIHESRGVVFRRSFRGVSIPCQNLVSKLHSSTTQAFGTIRVVDATLKLFKDRFDELAANFASLASSRGLDGWCVELLEVSDSELTSRFLSELATASSALNLCVIVNVADSLLPLEVCRSFRAMCDIITDATDLRSSASPHGTTVFEILRPTKEKSIFDVVAELRKDATTAPCLVLDFPITSPEAYAQHLLQCGILMDGLASTSSEEASILGTIESLPFRSNFDFGAGKHIFVQGQELQLTAGALHSDFSMSTTDAPSAAAAAFAKPRFSEGFLGHSSLCFELPRGAETLKAHLASIQGVTPTPQSSNEEKFTVEYFLTIQLAFLPKMAKNAQLTLTCGSTFTMPLFGAQPGGTVVKAAYEMTSSSTWTVKRFCLPLTSLDRDSLLRSGLSLHLILDGPSGSEALLLGQFGVDFVPVATPIGKKSSSALSVLHPTSALARSFAGGADPTSAIRFSVGEGYVLPIDNAITILRFRLNIEQCTFNRLTNKGTPKSYEMSAGFDPVALIVSVLGQYVSTVNLPIESTTLVAPIHQVADQDSLEVTVQAIDALGVVGSARRISLSVGSF